MKQPNTTTEKPRDQGVARQDGTIDQLTKTEVLNELWPWIDEASLERGNIDANRCMSAVKAFISFDRPLPKNLKDWFLEGLEAHAESKGAIKLDAIFGYTKSKSQRNAYKHAEAETPYLLCTSWNIYCLLLKA